MKRSLTHIGASIAALVVTVGLMAGCSASEQSLRPANTPPSTSTIVAAPTTAPITPAAAPGAPVPSIGQGAAPAASGGAGNSSGPVPGIAVAPAPARVSGAPQGAASSASIAPQPVGIPPISTPAPSLIHGIVVSGTGTASARPDQAIVSAGVQTRAATAQDAQAENNRIMQAAIGAIKALGIPDKDIQTTGVSLYPIIEQSQFVSGYTATNNVTITVENVDQAGAVLDAATKAGANVEGSVRFTLKDQSPVRSKALAAAAADAKSKATALAGALGLQITGIESVSESSVGGPIYAVAPRALAASQAGAPSVPVEPGQLDITAEVTIVFGY